MLKIPENIMAIVNACFAADIAFDLAVTIDGLAYRITSVDSDHAQVSNNRNIVIGTLTKD
jgi:hypothetical protein